MSMSEYCQNNEMNLAKAIVKIKNQCSHNWLDQESVIFQHMYSSEEANRDKLDTRHPLLVCVWHEEAAENFGEVKAED